MTSRSKTRIREAVRSRPDASCRGRCGCHWLHSPFVRSLASSGAFHSTLLLLLAILYASDSEQHAKPIALSFESSSESVDMDCPTIDLAFHVPNADLEQTHDAQELFETLDDLLHEPIDVPALASSIPETEEIRVVSLLGVEKNDLNKLVRTEAGPEPATFAESDEAIIAIPAQLARRRRNPRARDAADGFALSGIISSTEFGERLNAAGAKTGDVQISLAWNTIDDIDLHVTYTPGNGLVDNINWANRVGRLSGGMLDVDMNAHSGLVSVAPVENVFWPPASSPQGHFTVYVHFFRSWSGKAQVPVLVQIKNGDEITQHSITAILYSNPQPVRQFAFPNLDSQRKF